MTLKASLSSASFRLIALSLVVGVPSGCGNVGGVFSNQRTAGVDLSEKPPSITALPEAPREVLKVPEPDFARTLPGPLGADAELVRIPPVQPAPAPQQIAAARPAPQPGAAAALPPAPRPLEKYERERAASPLRSAPPIEVQAAPAIDIPALDVYASEAQVTALRPILTPVPAPLPPAPVRPQRAPAQPSLVYEPVTPAPAPAPRYEMAAAVPLRPAPRPEPAPAPRAAPAPTPRVDPEPRGAGSATMAPIRGDNAGSYAQGPAGPAALSPVAILHARLDSGAVVSVHPLVGLPIASSATLARTLATEMGAPVSDSDAAAALARFDLRGRSIGGARVQWTLEDPTGAVVGVFAEGEDAGSIGTATSDALSAMSRRVADRLRRNAALRRSAHYAVATRTGPMVATPVINNAPLAPATPVQTARAPRRAPDSVPAPRLRPERVVMQPIRTPAPQAPLPAVMAPAPRVVAQAPVIQPAPALQPSVPEYTAPAAPRIAAAPTPAPAPSFDTLRPAGQAVAAAPAAPVGPRPLVFRGVRGAPGDGDQALGREVRRLLSQSGANMAQSGVPGALYLVAQVSKRSGGGSDNIRIIWRVEDSNGASIGQVVQENDVPRGALDAAWGEDAYYAAQGARDGIMELLQAAGVLT